MSAASPAVNSFRSDATVISLVGFAHGTSHFFHFVMPPLFPLPGAAEADTGGEESRIVTT